MNKIKNFIYDKNDLLVALIIVALAALVIVFRVDTIMAYPSSVEVGLKPPVSDDKPPISDETSMGGSETDPDGGDDEGDGVDETDDGQLEEEEGNEDSDNEETSDSDQGNQADPNTPPQGEGLVSIYIESGSTGSDIARLLINSGLIKTKEEFYSAVTAAGADTRLKAGNFKIPSNATPAEIVKIITK